MTDRVHSSCSEIRVKRKTYQKFNMATGELRTVGRETVTEPCGAPLFSDPERASGICKACASGWTADGNRPATPTETAAYFAQEEA